MKRTESAKLLDYILHVCLWAHSLKLLTALSGVSIKNLYAIREGRRKLGVTTAARLLICGGASDSDITICLKKAIKLHLRKNTR